MNKRLLGLLMVGVLTATSLSSLTAFAATSNVIGFKKTVEAKATPQTIWFEATALPGAELYSRPYSDCYSWTVQKETPVKCQFYGSNWYKVKFNDGSTYYSWRLSNIVE